MATLELPATELVVRQVANGWEVNNGGNWYSRRNGECPPDQTWVFTDVKSMADWMTSNLKEPENK